jgi:hypothetical protein
MSPDKIKECLQSLGYKLSDRGSYWQTNALFRNGDNSTAIQIYKNTGVWKDYVQNSPYSPLQKLVEVTLGTNDPKEIKKYLEEEDIGSTYNKIESDEKIKMEEVYPEECLDKLLPHYKFYNERGIGDEVIKALKGGFAMNGKLNKRFVFPIYNEHNQIIGFSGRDMIKSEPNSNRPKWKHIGTKKSWIYPLYVDNSFRESVVNSGEVILVESIGDLLRLNQFGYNNVLVTFGLDVSTKLTCAMVSLGISRIVLSLNNDEKSERNRGLEASIKNYLKLLNFFDRDKLAICLPSKKDFGEMNDEDFNIWGRKLRSISPSDQRKMILKKLDSIEKHIPKAIIKNKKILLDE